MSLLSELNKVLTQFPNRRKVIDWLPRYLSDEVHLQSSATKFQLFLVHDSGDRVDIGITKAAYLKIFKEAHSGWHQYLDRKTCVSSLTSDELRELYLVTLGYFFTTNDNHMIAKIHEEILAELYKQDESILDQELEALTTLVSCKLAKINKSMLLWNLIKRVSLVMFVAKDKPESAGSKYNAVIERTLLSCEHHYANYYANNFLKVLIRLNRIFDRDDQIYDCLLTLCHKHLNDVSLWMTLAVYFEDPGPLRYAVEDYNYTMGHINKLFGTNFTTVSYQEKETKAGSFKVLAQQLEWLLAVKCARRSPYVAILRHVSGSHDVKTILQSFLSKQQLLHTSSTVENPLYLQEQEFTDTLNYLLKQF